MTNETTASLKASFEAYDNAFAAGGAQGEWVRDLAGGTTRRANVRNGTECPGGHADAEL